MQCLMWQRGVCNILGGVVTREGPTGEETVKEIVHWEDEK